MVNMTVCLLPLVLSYRIGYTLLCYPTLCCYIFNYIMLFYPILVLCYAIAVRTYVLS